MYDCVSYEQNYKNSYYLKLVPVWTLAAETSLIKINNENENHKTNSHLT